MKADYVLLQDRLKGEYKDAFQKVQMYSTSNLIGEDTESELMMELLDHMLMAQEIRTDTIIRRRIHGEAG